MSKLSGSHKFTSDSARREALHKSQSWLREGRADLALPLLSRLHTHAPEDLDIHQAFATALLRDGLAEAALEKFNGLQKRQPHNAAAHHGRALCLHAIGHRQPALEAFRQAVSVDRQAWRAWQSIADITPYEDERVHALEAAADALGRLSACDNASPVLLAAATTALIEARQPSRAPRLLELRGATETDSPVLIRAYARSLYHQGNFKAALYYAMRFMAQTKPHCKSPSSPARFEPDRARAVLAEIQDLLRASGVESFLAAGTLLGFHRNGGPLPHDRDIDIGILRKPGGGPDIAAILRRHPQILLPRISRPGDRYFGLTHKNVAVDIFLYDRQEDHLLCGLSALPGDIQWRFTRFNLETRGYAGNKWTVPKDPECYLAETYGPGWQRPDTGFASAVSSPALFETHDDVRSYYAVVRACRAAEAGNILKARSLLTQAPHDITPPAEWAEGRATP